MTPEQKAISDANTGSLRAETWNAVPRLSQSVNRNARSASRQARPFRHGWLQSWFRRKPSNIRSRCSCRRDRFPNATIWAAVLSVSQQRKNRGDQSPDRSILRFDSIVNGESARPKASGPFCRRTAAMGDSLVVGAARRPTGRVTPPGCCRRRSCRSGGPLECRRLPFDLQQAHASQHAQARSRERKHPCRRHPAG